MKRIFALVAATFAFVVMSFTSPDPIDVEFGPWVTNVTENSFTVVWTTKTDNLGWVEATPDAKGAWMRRKVTAYHQEFAGRWTFGRFHSVEVTGLEPGVKYYYRVCGKKVVDDSVAQDMVFGIDKSTGVFTVTTFDSSKAGCHFSVLNDMHLNVDKISALASQVDCAKTDFLLYNGDITSAGNYSNDTLARYYIAPLGKLTGSIPVMFARGNHEGRGNNWMGVRDLFPNPTPGQFYYTFREGPVAFIVLDSGETKPVVAKSYVGECAYFDYLEKELAWAEEAMKDPSFAEAPVKICISHVTMTPKGGDDYNTQCWMNDNFVPALNAAGIDLMINAHTHKNAVIAPGTVGNDFPMFVNNNSERLQVDVDADAIKLMPYDVNGQPVPGHSFELNLRK